MWIEFSVGSSFSRSQTLRDWDGFASTCAVQHLMCDEVAGEHGGGHAGEGQGDGSVKN